jgi:hypothetical protein
MFVQQLATNNHNRLINNKINRNFFQKKLCLEQLSRPLLLYRY